MDSNYDCRKTGEEVELEREKFEWYKEQYERERDEAKQKSVKEAENERNTAIATVIITGIILIGPFIVAGVCGLVELIGNKANEHKARKKVHLQRKMVRYGRTTKKQKFGRLIINPLKTIRSCKETCSP